MVTDDDNHSIAEQATKTDPTETIDPNSSELENYLEDENKNLKLIENLDPNDPNYKHHKLLLKIQKAYSKMPPGWSKNPSVGTKTGEAPYIHEDGRQSWKNPNAKEINAMLEAAREEEEKELEILNGSSSKPDGHDGMTHDESNGGEMKKPSTALNQRILKKYRLMVKRGVPVAAVLQKALLIDHVNLNEADLLSDSSQESSSNKSKNCNVSVVKDIKSKSTSEDATTNPVTTAPTNKEQEFQERQKNALIKKYQKMFKTGVPIENIKSMAIREMRSDDVDFLVPLLVPKTNGKDAETEEIDSSCFNPVSGSDKVEFALSKSNKEINHLARLVQKMVLTVNKGRLGIRNELGSDAILTTSLKDLYNALGAFRGVQVARDTYNATCGENCKDMNESEFKAKRKPFLELIRNLGLRNPTSLHEEVDIKGLDKLIQHIEHRFKLDLKGIKETIDVGMYDFNSLTEIYKPGSRVVAKSVFASGVDMIFEVSWSRFEEGRSLFGTTRSFKVCFQFIVAVGEHFTMCEYVESIENFDGRRHINALNFVPLSSFDSNSMGKIEATFRRRGELYGRCATGANFMSYEKGSFFAKGGKSGIGGDRTAALRTAGRVMIDTQGSYEAGHSLGIGNDLIITDIKQKYKEYMLAMRAQKKRAHDSHNSKTSMDDDSTTMILFDKIPNDYLEMTWPAVVGFSFTSKSWGEVLIDGLNDVHFNESAFENLVLPPSRKRMVKALVRHSNISFNDIVSGKGEGSVFLLYGPPGTGKTLTAEAVSEMLHRPLYSVSLGQLGTSPAELEKKLGEVLDLCSRWDALILLDEADIFLEKRSSTGSLERNAMVSVMLRLVEYFKGTLFLTSNRVDSLDPAFKTRITLALRYDQLDSTARSQVWINLLNKSGFGSLVENKAIDVSKLAVHQLNGREIKNAIRLAMALAEEDKELLSQELILETIETLNDFNEKMNAAEMY